MRSFKEFIIEADLSKAGKGTFLSVLEENPDGWSVFRFSQFSGGGTKKLAGGFRSKPLAIKKATEIAKKTGERVSSGAKRK
jgi:hypothetical protein